MDAQLEDLRLLRLALMYEHAFESFVAAMTERHLDEATRARLAPLQPERDQHEARIRAIIERIESNIPRDQRRDLMRAVLLDIVDVERAAREFYLNHLDRVHDRDVVRLFHELAAEEGRHVRVAEDALAKLQPDEADDTPREPVDIPAWEGTTDLGRSERRTKRRAP